MLRCAQHGAAAAQQRSSGLPFTACGIPPLRLAGCRRPRTAPQVVASTASLALPACSTSGAWQQPAATSAPAVPAALQQVARAIASNPAVLLVASVVHVVYTCVEKARDAVSGALPKLDVVVNGKDVKQQVLELRKCVRVLAFVAPIAKAIAAESLTTVYARTFERAAFGFAKMYLFCLFMRVLLSWFPSIDWNSQPWAFLRLITEPYLQIYRGILPPLFGQLDFTPLFGFLILQDVVELMSPVYTMGHARETSMFWTTTDIMCYFDGH